MPGGLLVFYTDGVVTIGTIVVFAEYARQFTRPLADLSNQFNQVLSAIAGAERVFGIIDSEPEKDEGKITGRTIAGEIEFDDVSFSYDPTQKTPTIRNLSFRIDAGESVALIGATGAGKTTVMQLLARFYETDSGEVRIDGENILDYSRSTVRSQTAFVLQDPYLFESTIRRTSATANLMRRMRKWSRRQSLPTPTNSSLRSKRAMTRCWKPMKGSSPRDRSS